MIKRIMQIINFLKVGIWHVKRKDVSTFLYFFYGVIKKLFLLLNVPQQNEWSTRLRHLHIQPFLQSSL